MKVEVAVLGSLSLIISLRVSAGAIHATLSREGQSHKTVSAKHSLFEEKGQSKRNRAQALRLTSLTAFTARPSRPTGRR